MKKYIADFAHDVAKKKYKNKKFKFRDLCNEISQLNSEYNDEFMDLYISMINDIRFVSIGNEYWLLKEYLKYDDYEKYISSMFGYDNDELELEDEDSKNLNSNNYDDSLENYDNDNLDNELSEIDSTFNEDLVIDDSMDDLDLIDDNDEEFYPDDDSDEIDDSEIEDDIDDIDDEDVDDDFE